ncbi:phenylacetaldehyde oxime monooxygenase CYP71AN24 isoform X1 [Arachis hypogaea]|uniref:Cytochrome P450 n=1 Tax=Arachis hypogaea TaxID=3818 RepID=A0A444XFK2_ARAHY|nr:cytochrome P450 71A1 isoform X1 [Arachis hypogaea]RYQ88505.1 hypothetical protein Ahy_B09g095656 isoform A [Arachis hypogaea]
MAFKTWIYDQIQEPLLSNIYLWLLFTITVFFVFNHTKKSKPNPMNLPPSPPKLPFIGNLLQFGTLPHLSLRNLSNTYGDIMMLQLGQKPNPTLVVSSAELAKKIAKNHDLVFSNRPQNTATKILLYGATDVGFGLYGDDWRQKRKICVLQLLSTRRVQSFRAIREEEVEEMVRVLMRASSNEEAVNLGEMVVSSSNNIVCKCALGRKYGKEGGIQDLARRVMIYLTAFTVGDYFPALGWVDVVSGKIGRYRETFKTLDGLFDKVIEEHKMAKKGESDGDGSSNDKKDLVDVLLGIQEDAAMVDGEYKLTNNDIKSLLMDMFVGGTDTTSATIEWAMTRLVQNPEIMKKVQEEVRRVVRCNNSSKVEENHINQMQYFKCVVKETLRLHPPCTVLPPRETMAHVKLNGFDIPAKTMVLTNAWAIQRDPKLWERPEEFMPERFEKSEIDFNGDQWFEFLPFGYGRRGCPGVFFGVAIVEYVLASLLYWFDWKLPENISSAHDIDMSEEYGLVVSKKVPLHLKPIAHVRA